MHAPVELPPARQHGLGIQYMHGQLTRTGAALTGQALQRMPLISAALCGGRGAHLDGHLAVPGVALQEARHDEAPGGRVQRVAGDVVALKVLPQLAALEQHPGEAAHTSALHKTLLHSYRHGKTDLARAEAQHSAVHSDASKAGA